MRRLIMAAAILSLWAWALPAYAQDEPDSVSVGTKCCQRGVTYDAPAVDDIPTCEEVSILHVCPKGSKGVSGTCQKDGACSGSKVCCEGASIGGACTTFLDETTAVADSCAESTELACDAKGAGGESTVSTPGGKCVDNSCVVPTTPPP